MANTCKKCGKEIGNGKKTCKRCKNSKNEKIGNALKWVGGVALTVVPVVIRIVGGKDFKDKS